MIFWRLNNKTISYYYKKVLMVLSFMCKLFDAYISFNASSYFNNRANVIERL